MYLKYFLITGWIIESILALGIESGTSNVTALHVRKIPNNLQGYLHNGNESQTVPIDKIQYTNEDSTDSVLKAIDDFSRLGKALDLVNVSDYSSTRPQSDYAEYPKHVKPVEPNLNSNFDDTIEGKGLESGKNIFEYRSHKMTFPNQKEEPVEVKSLESGSNIFENRSHKIQLTNHKDYNDTKKSVLSKKKTGSNQHLCISVHKTITAMNYLYECKSKEFRNFVCVDIDGKLAPCNKYNSNQQLYDQLCIKKMQFSHVIPCNRPEVEGFCFPAPNRKSELIPCDEENLKVCYRSGYGLVNCKMVEEQRELSRKRRLIQGEEIDPRNVKCSNCEVDILMEVYQGSTPRIEVKVKPLNE